MHGNTHGCTPKHVNTYTHKHTHSLSLTHTLHSVPIISYLFYSMTFIVNTVVILTSYFANVGTVVYQMQTLVTTSIHTILTIVHCGVLCTQYMDHRQIDMIDQCNQSQRESSYYNAQWP